MKRFTWQQQGCRWGPLPSFQSRSVGEWRQSSQAKLVLRLACATGEKRRCWPSSRGQCQPSPAPACSRRHHSALPPACGRRTAPTPSRVGADDRRQHALQTAISAGRKGPAASSQPKLCTTSWKKPLNAGLAVIHQGPPGGHGKTRYNRKPPCAFGIHPRYRQAGG